MRFVHPSSAEIMKRVISPSNGEYALSYGVITTFPLHPDAPLDNPSISQVWPIALPNIGETGILDEGWPKTRGEFLVYGCAYCPSDFKEQPISVKVRLGKFEKQLAIFGNRTINSNNRISQPSAFVRLPIRPQEAFGGEGHLKNPLGKGITSLFEMGEEVWPMPNVELPKQLMINHTDLPDPAGFWALSQEFPQRTCYLGEFDNQWQKDRWPHLPLATQAAFYQSAPTDQQLNDFFQGDESITIHHMHAQYPLLESRLPSLRGRVFIERELHSGQRDFEEHSCRADTVWLFPDNLVGMIMYRATIPTSDMDADDIVNVYSAFESMNQTPLTIEEHYQRFLIQAGRVSVANIDDGEFDSGNTFDAEIASESKELNAVQTWAQSVK
jgi:hypothetical protein